MDLKIGDYLVDVEPEGKLDYQKALVIAVKKEKAAFKLYAKLSESTEDEKLRSLMLALAQEEAKRYHPRQQSTSTRWSLQDFTAPRAAARTKCNLPWMPHGQRNHDGDFARRQTELRRRAAAMVNMRPGCVARLTAKRSLENYLHPAAIEEASGFEIQVSDDCDVADLLARQSHLRQGGQPPWEELPRGTHKRRRNRVKKWLVTKATDRMTPERLAERDPKGEVASWLKTITELAQTRH